MGYADVSIYIGGEIKTVPAYKKLVETISNWSDYHGEVEVENELQTNVNFARFDTYAIRWGECDEIMDVAMELGLDAIAEVQDSSEVEGCTHIYNHKRDKDNGSWRTIMDFEKNMIHITILKNIINDITFDSVCTVSRIKDAINQLEQYQDDTIRPFSLSQDVIDHLTPGPKETPAGTLHTLSLIGGEA